ncbi:LLM class flavin-dependent oxidoreductase [Gordonia sp. CPCC 205333]|uniref:LLM class flavin-dependent oxidoreductase n=1 Tax=Gordonia sp. CPCC 205333 TaxID=3140790 RepID=UPI003AF3D4D0
MPSRSGQVSLGVNALVTGYLPASWQADGLTATSFVDPEYWTRIGRIAERGTLDAVFLADGPALTDPAYDANPAHLEPTITWAHVAAATERIGLVATASTTYNDPVELAERLLSLDILSGGRAAWNIVTTVAAAPARNFGLPEVPHRDDRYARAAEFVDLVRALWASAATGQRVAYESERFVVAEGLSTPPSPQGGPVLFQAGGSPQGRRLAARLADGVFTAELTKDKAIEHYDLVKRLAEQQGRRAGDIRILPGLLLSLGSTEEEARRRNDELHDAGPPSYSLGWLSHAIGYDATTLDLDAPFPDEVLEPPKDPGRHPGSLGFRESVIARIRLTNPTVREYLHETRYTGSGHRGFTGTPEQLADFIEDWFHSGAADGFNLQPDVLAEGLEVIVDELVPILRRRGLFRHDYAETTLRGNLLGTNTYDETLQTTTSP